MPVEPGPEKIPVVLLYNVDPGWTKDEQDEVVSQSRLLGDALMEEGHTVHLAPLTNDDIATCLHPFNPSEYIVFNWCEEIPGIGHSEWLAAKKLEDLGFTFTGAESKTLALAQDKLQVKRLLDRAGIPTPFWSAFHRDNGVAWHRFPAIVKPAREHCSAGITRDAVVLDESELKERVLYVLDTYRQPALVEDFIDGREFHVGLWGNGVVEMLPPAEMDFSAFASARERLCTYDSKFSPGSPHYERVQVRVPAALAPEQARRLEAVCQGAYRALGCRDWCRIDVRLDGDTAPHVIELNPLPGILPNPDENSCFPKAARAAGMDYGDLVREVLRIACRRCGLDGEGAR